MNLSLIKTWVIVIATSCITTVVQAQNEADLNKKVQQIKTYLSNIKAKQNENQLFVEITFDKLLD
nr:hypothetical protein [Saprospiraceae bacterium]